MRENIELVIITGMSGAGKTQAVRCLEDLGFFCVDNLPPSLVPPLAELFGRRDNEVEKVALVMDIRGGRFFSGLSHALKYLEQGGFKYEVLFLEASDEALVRRFKETRRHHPLAPKGGILEGVMEERSRLLELRGEASKIIDTSELTPQQLKEQIAQLFAAGQDRRMALTVLSFGYKYGIPLDADLVMDVRFLPNPYYVENLRPLTGEDQEVQDYVMASLASQEFLQKFSQLLSFLLPYYVMEGKSHLMVAIGCTGGQHRSVTLANHTAKIIAAGGEFRVMVQHRDLHRSKRGACDAEA
jgi:UPF0042 nucleotide-binding protein